MGNKVLNNNFKLITFLIPYFGSKMPSYFPFFLNSCQFNKKCDFIIFTDAKITDPTPENVKIIKTTKEELQELIYKKIKVKVDLDGVRKICDLKPAFGEIFGDYFCTAYWAHSDIDLIYGKIEDFILKAKEKTKFDVYSFRKFWLSGSCSVYKNTRPVNLLFKKSKDWKKVFSSKNHHFFDECGIPINNKDNIYILLSNGLPLEKIPTEIESFTHVLRRQGGKDGLKIIFEDKTAEILKSDEIIKVYNGNIEKLSKEGSLENRKKYIIYHFIGEKNRRFFKFPPQQPLKEFYISIFGYHTKRREIKKDMFIRVIRGCFNYLTYVKTIKKILAKSKTIY